MSNLAAYGANLTPLFPLTGLTQNFQILARLCVNHNKLSACSHQPIARSGYRNINTIHYLSASTKIVHSDQQHKRWRQQQAVTYSLASDIDACVAPTGIPCLCMVSTIVCCSSELQESKSKTLRTTVVRPSVGNSWEGEKTGDRGSDLGQQLSLRKIAI